MSIYSCKSCNIASFATKQAYERHIVSQKHLKGSEDGTKKFICVCGKWFLYSSGLSAHKKKCKTHNNNNNNNESESVNINIENMQQKIEDFEKEREEMKAQIAMLLDKHAGITTNNNRTNIDTQNNTINIHINAFGNENTDYLDDKAILQCIDRVYKSIPAIRLHNMLMHRTVLHCTVPILTNLDSASLLCTVLAQVTQKGSSQESEIRTLTKGDYFGEQVGS